jgi:signal recognition particle subunit SEC65
MLDEALTRALADVDCIQWDSPSYWEQLISRAREGNMLGALAARIEERGIMERVPRRPRAHLQAVGIQIAAQAKSVRYEVREISSALRKVVSPLILLKGAAYLLADLPPARGRLFSDIDILVPKPLLNHVEAALMQAGFVTTHHHPHDQRYYREWMHELPPMRHVKRGTVLDVHHAIVPETVRSRPDSRLLLESAVTLPNSPGVAVLAPEDLVIHCATHIFRDEDFSHAPRDMLDFDALLRHFGPTESFWPRLIPRAEALSLGRPLYYALRWSSRLHQTPIPTWVAASAATFAPPLPVERLMDALLSPALRPTVARAATRWARNALYLRGHWLKMPLPLLAWHLTVKSMRREERPA